VRFFKLVFIFLLTILTFSCKKDLGLIELEGDFEVKKVVCYPYDTTTVNVIAKIKGGKEPYVYFWNTDPNKGEDNINIKFKTKTSGFVKVVDADNQSKNFTYIVERTKYDSLAYDYREPIVGNYDCMLTQWSLSPGGVNFHYNAVTYSLTIKKASNFSKITINAGIGTTNYTDVDIFYNNVGGNFNGIYYNNPSDTVFPYNYYIYNGNLNNDSIHFKYYFLGGYSWRKEFVGKKTN
jgi:hypothetical protein